MKAYVWAEGYERIVEHWEKEPKARNHWLLRADYDGLRSLRDRPDWPYLPIVVHVSGDEDFRSALWGTSPSGRDTDRPYRILVVERYEELPAKWWQTYNAVVREDEEKKLVSLIVDFLQFARTKSHVFNPVS